eukprot:TRINITY_DN18588_c0_g1_i4.p3 TRINITY_DN18588_c0_g1~~TRINITY_DN18588_c0_g1_i4.p3  ORF type:complete len:143 (+),score=6.97 TRINITY_DN18588_c0_g1_i4:755-1183(+)
MILEVLFFDRKRNEMDLSQVFVGTCGDYRYRCFGVHFSVLQGVRFSGKFWYNLEQQVGINIANIFRLKLLRYYFDQHVQRALPLNLTFKQIEIRKLVIVTPPKCFGIGINRHYPLKSVFGLVFIQRLERSNQNIREWMIMSG